MAINQFTDAVPTAYARRDVPPTVEQLGDFLQFELLNAGTTLVSLTDLSPQATDVAPSSPPRGMIRFAVAPWDPGYGSEHFYWYDGSDWQLLSPDQRGFQNHIINGNFGIWQRGTSLGSASGARHLADCWANDSAGSTYTVSQQTFTVGQGVVPMEPKYFHRTVVTSVAGSGNYAVLRHSVEGVRRLAGQKASVSFWAKADASKQITAELAQSFGTGGSPSSAVTSLGVTKVTLTTSWQRFTLNTTLPSISGKTIGSNGDDALRLLFWFDAGSTYNSRSSSLGQQSGTFDIAQVELREGPPSARFDARPIGIEKALCQRYYFKTFPEATTPAQNAGTTGGFMFGQLVAGASNARYPTVPFPVHMRTTPTITTYNPSAANAQPRNTTAAADYSAVSVDAEPWGWSFWATGPAGGAVGHTSVVHITADASL